MSHHMIDTVLDISVTTFRYEDHQAQAHIFLTAGRERLLEAPQRDTTISGTIQDTDLRAFAEKLRLAAQMLDNIALSNETLATIPTVKEDIEEAVIA